MAQEIKKLIDGYKEFRKKFFNSRNTLFDELVEQGQRPKIMIIACSDSRVDPAVIFNCQPGELFVIRNVANLIPPYEENSDTYHGTSAALEFGTCFLEVEHIIILGHTQCGGIRALLNAQTSAFGNNHQSFIVKWMEIAKPAYERVIAENGYKNIEEKIIVCEQYALINSLQNLQTFSWIQQRVGAGKLSLHAWYFDLATGMMHMYDSENNTWLSL